MSQVKRTLLILRHGKTSQALPGMGDRDRPLTSRGEQDVAKIGQFALGKKLLPDLIITSSARRCHETAKIFAQTVGHTNGILAVDELYEAPVDKYVAQLQTVPDQHLCVLLVGHNPGLEHLIDDLTKSKESLVPGTLAKIKIQIDFWAKLTAPSNHELKKLWRPDDV